MASPSTCTCIQAQGRIGSSENMQGKSGVQYSPSRRHHGKMSCEHGHVCDKHKTGETQNYITIFIDQPMRRIDVLDGDAVCDAIRRNRAKANRN
jgi:hypothetical protein